MKLVLFVVGFCVLLFISWPIALLALVLLPLFWLVSLPFRLVALTVHAAFALIAALLFLPARLLGWRRCGP